MNLEQRRAMLKNCALQPTKLSPNQSQHTVNMLVTWDYVKSDKPHHVIVQGLYACDNYMSTDELEILHGITRKDIL